MTDQQINEAIAKLCGWSDILKGKYDGMPFGRYKDHTLQPIPDYCNDLNAMHEAFEAIHISKIDLLEHHLGELTRTEVLAMRRSFVGERYKLFTATARTCAEAFLRAHGKWVEE